MSSIELEREAHKLVRPYLIGIAWPTVFLALGVLIAFITVLSLALGGLIPLWAGLLLNTFVLYSAQTPLHDAVHGAICGKDRRYKWLNDLVGYVCGSILIHDFKMFRQLHILHHTEVNDPALDPDSWVFGSNVFTSILRALTTPLRYHYYFFRHIFFKRENIRDTIHIILVYNIYYGIIFWASWLGYWREAFMLWYIPHVLATAMIIFFFGYLVHPPEETEDRYKDTRILFFKGPIGRFIDKLWFSQDMHLIHHLYPRVPFFLYRRAFKDLRPVLEKAGSPIYEFETGREPEPVLHAGE